MPSLPVNCSLLCCALLALPLAVAAQTTPAPVAKPQQVTEVTEDIDPATGKVIRRTTRTTTLPAGSATPLPAPTGTAAADDAPVVPATNATVSDFLREKTVVNSLSAPQLVDAYAHFMDVVHDQRQGWKATDWYRAATVLSALNARYNQLRDSYSLDDKLTIRGQQIEFQTLRTARQLTDQVSNKL